MNPVYIKEHVLGMYLPSFFTGNLINRLGLPWILLTGALLLAGAVLASLSGVEMENFALGLVLLGVGWNFLFIGGSTLLTETYRPEEGVKVQGANEFCVFATVAFTAFSSGVLHEGVGWESLNLIVLPAALVVAVAGGLAQP